MTAPYKQLSILKFVLIGAIIIFILCLPLSKCDNDTDTSIYNAEDHKNYLPWNLLKSMRNLHTLKKNVIICPQTSTEYSSDIIDFTQTLIVIDSHATALPDVQALMKHYNTSDVIYLPLSGEVEVIEDSLTKLNDLLQNNTNGKIQDHRAKSKEIDSSVVIFHMLYFKIQWRNEFKFEVNTTFYLAPNKAKKVAAVETTDNFYYIDSLILDAKVIRLPFSASNISMYVLLPHTKAGADQLFQNLSNDQLKRLQWMMEETRVRVIMPKLNFNFKINIGDDAPHESLYDHNIFGGEVTKANIFHISGIRLNGNGAKKDIPSKSSPMRFEHFIIDRPFIFYIEQEKSGQIICIGKINDPSV